MGEEIALSWVLKVKRDVALILEVLDLHSDLPCVPGNVSSWQQCKYMLVECMFVSVMRRENGESAELQVVFSLILRGLYSQ